MAKTRQRPEAPAVSCEDCGARCCRYVATQIDTPTSKRDYDYLRWYLLHSHVNVFIDHGGGWFIEFETPCEQLGEDHRCTGYETRPDICRQHGIGDTDCEFHGATEPYKRRFKTAAALEEWLDKRGIDWRFKPRGGRRVKTAGRDQAAGDRGGAESASPPC